MSAGHRVLRTARVCAFLALPLVAGASTAQQTSLVHKAKTTVTAAASNVWHGTQDLAVYALGLIGVSYKFGGEHPDQGLDCSGLVRHVFQQVTGVSLPRTARELSSVGGPVPLHELKPGDLVFFNTRRFAFSHVGIYVGDNRFIHAPRTGREVEIAHLDNRYWQKHFNGARRLVGVLPSLVPSLIASAEAAPVALSSESDFVFEP
ncbi:MAG TPA: C40 family peptidase [Casimicrobiaceae bacterium]|nr:C40 family peptidase [Casimicrobiaceae bacterium]